MADQNPNIAAIEGDPYAGLDYYEAELLRAKDEAKARGKEPFDFVKFAANYSHDVGSCERLKPDSSPAVQSYYERMYYVEFPEAMTSAEFARMKDDFDMQGG